jgi:hypothetical protein
MIKLTQNTITKFLKNNFAVDAVNMAIVLIITANTVCINKPHITSLIPLSPSTGIGRNAFTPAKKPIHK